MRNDSAKSISVIIPAYNSARFLGQAIESVQQQTVQPAEIIVIDDGSTDDTKSLVKSLKGSVQYHFQENRGQAAARNKGLQLATGDLITFIDADDIWIRNKLEIQLALLQDQPRYEMAIGFLELIPMAETKKVVQKTGKGIFTLHLGSILMRKKVFDKVGVFDEDMRLCDDTEWFFRVLEQQIKVKVHRDVVQLYRQHDNNITRDENRNNLYLLKSIKKSLDRRRKLSDSHAESLPAFDDMEKIMNYWQDEGAEFSENNQSPRNWKSQSQNV